jgi:HK97 family phage prohead protease
MATRRSNRFFDKWKKEGKDVGSREWVHKMHEAYESMSKEEKGGRTFEQFYFQEETPARETTTFRTDFQVEGDETGGEEKNRLLLDGEFRGIAAATDVVVDSHPPTVIKPGAFKETIVNDRDRIKILWQHNSDEPIGLPVHMEETDRGLEVVGQLSDTQTARDALELMRDGVVSELSIGWTPQKFEYEEIDEKVHRIVHKLELWEFSPVTWGANKGAKILEVNELPGLEEDAKSKVQTVIFSKRQWTKEKAASWLGGHKFKSSKVDETENTYRFRQFDPEKCKAGSFVSLTQNMPAGVTMVACDTDSATATNEEWLAAVAELELESLADPGSNSKDNSSDEGEETSLPSLVEKLADVVVAIGESEEPLEEGHLEALASASDVLRSMVERENAENEPPEVDLTAAEAVLAAAEAWTVSG